MSRNSWLASLRALVCGGDRRPVRSRRCLTQSGSRLRLEAMEDRLVPATVSYIAFSSSVGLL
jgi:hypothetical protein